MYVLSAASAGEFLVEDGVLLSFSGLTTTVNIPDGVYYIADGAFKDNTNIKKVNLNDDVKIIGNEAFFGCTSLKEVNGGSVSYVGAYAFYATPWFVNREASLVTLGSVLLGGQVNSELIVPDNIEMIAPYAFSEEENLTSFTSSESLKVIGEGAFYRCNNLGVVNIGESVTNIGPLAFYSTAFVSEAESDFVIAGSGHLIQYKGSKEVVNIPGNVSFITGGAFYSNTAIKEVNIPDSVTSVGERAFMNCSKLTSLSLCDGLLMIGKEAFARCKALKNITVPSSVEVMGESAFYGCNALESAVLKNNSDIPRGLFANCSSLSYVVAPAQCTSVGEGAFLNCSSLTDVSLSDSIENIADDAFSGARAVTVSCNKTSFAYDYCAQMGINAIQCGDANLDGKVNIRDATYIQKHVASIVTMSEIEALRAETNFDGKLNVRDATYVQKLLAGLI